MIGASEGVRCDVPIPTWFGVGGGADRFASPLTFSELAGVVRDEPVVRVLGDGANLLVDDGGVDGLVVSLASGELSSWSIDEASGVVRVGAGANLPKLILECVRRGLGGIEGLAGVPATIGGAAVMNAGGRYGEIGDVLVRVAVLDEAGHEVWIDRDELGLGYRRSSLGGRLVTRAELRLEPGDPVEIRDQLKRVMGEKAKSQPLAAKSCGCVFRNSDVTRAVEGISEQPGRLSAGMLLDRAGCKGMTQGGVRISERHANFFETGADATASDVLRLIDEATARVDERFGVRLEPEVVVWRRGE